jgi:integrase
MTSSYPDLSNENAHGAYSASLIKRYGRYLKELFGRDIAKTLTSHCFRHLVETQLANTALKETWINELMGHEGDRPSEADRTIKACTSFGSKYPSGVTRLAGNEALARCFAAKPAL